jgi:HSP20 family molecular chaperone IbpA
VDIDHNHAYKFFFPSLLLFIFRQVNQQMSTALRILPRNIKPSITKVIKHPISRRTMALFPRMSSSFGPYRSEMGPFFNLFNDTFSELQKLSDTASRSFVPKFDVKETKDNYLLEGELPGIDQKDVVIEFADEQTLTIKGRTDRLREEGDKPTEAMEVNANTNTQSPSSSTEVTTTGGKDIAQAHTQHHYWVSERSVGEFARSFNFPNPVDHDRVKASMKNGILSVTVPKMEKAKGQRRIQINSE